MIGEEFDWQPTPKGPREPGQIFAAYRRRHAEIEAEHRRSYEELEQSHRLREQDLLRRIGELEAAVNGHAPRQGGDAALSLGEPPGETPGSREAAILPEASPPPSPDTPGSPESLENDPPGLGEDNLPGPTAELPQPHGQELDSRETAIAPDPDPQQGHPEEPEDEVDLLTREFWPWIKGKWDDINNAIHWYKRNRGEWTRQLKNARAAKETEERGQAKPGDRADRHRPGYEPEGENPERVPIWDSRIKTDPDARSLWDAVLADLQLKLPRPTFETWLKPTAGAAFQGDRFIVVAPTPFAVEWLQQRMFHALQSALERAAGRGLAAAVAGPGGLSRR